LSILYIYIIFSIILTFLTIFPLHQHPNVVAEWHNARDMQENGVKFTILGMCQFLRREVFMKARDQFFELQGPLPMCPQLIQYERFGI
jgi:multisubunit Na+/H+ antiporter MnhG subunit